MSTVPDNALAGRIASAPFLSSPDRAHARVAEWLSEIEEPATAGAVRDLLAAFPTAAALIAGLADASPHLWDLARGDPSRLNDLLRSDPDERFPSLLSRTKAQIGTLEGEAEAMRLLRRMKAEGALLIALADIGGVWPVMQVTHALTQLADTAVSAAVRFLLAEATRSGKMTPTDPAQPEVGSGYIVLAMGKMGAFELNYSSDIDLIVFYDSAVPAVASGVEPGPLFVRITRGLVKLLQERTADGYVCRVDLRLRPDPASTQIAISTAAALDYYESVGQNWERAAMIKARPCAGDIEAGNALLRELSPFVWRKYLDFAAVADVHAMKRQIHAYRGHAEIAVEGHNVKLGRGGIREIEFFVQTQQLIAGGRYPGLRDRETLTMLGKLVEDGWIDAEARTDLDAAYCFLRMVEHRLQMVADEQTHTLPAERDDLERFARFAGFENRDAFARVLLQHLNTVQARYATLFESPRNAASERPTLLFPDDKDDRETLDRLVELGFRQPLEASATVRRWMAGEYRSLKSTFARERLAELAPVLIEHLARTENPDAALTTLDRFFEGLHAGGRLFSLLQQNPDLVALIALVIGVAPRLAEILARHPQVMDTLIDPRFFGALPDAESLAVGLARSLEQAQSYEDFLDRIRLFGQEQMFLIGARILSGTLSAEQAGETFARLADVLVRALHRSVEDTFAQAHGRLAKQEIAILALGKLGGREMTASSDLDLIVIYDFDHDEPQSDGARPLYGSQYFARLTQRLINALTVRTNYGVLYEVDMRLRPSGRSGPVATRIDSFEAYQENEAWTWEHMALTRARVISASPEFRARVEGVIQTVLRRSRDAQQIAADVYEMRRAIADERGEDDRWNLKYAAGGLVDLEFIAQYLQLVHAVDKPELLDTSTARVLEKAWRAGVLSTDDAEVLRPAVHLYQDLTQILRLCLPGPFDPKVAGPGLLRLLARAADVPDFASLDAHVTETQARVRACFERIVGKAG